MSSTNSREIRITGINGSSGICIGKAYLVDKEGVDVIEKYYIREERIVNEINRFKAAVQQAKDELAAIIDDIPEEFRNNLEILEAQMVMHKDKMLYGRTIEMIKNEQVNAEWALKKVVADINVMFQKISDPYLRSRSSDISNVSTRIMRYLLGTEEINIAEIDKRVILVAHDLSPAETSQIQLERIKGFVTDLGGKTSHTGIIARSLQIPCVLGLETATQLIKNDDIIIVDGITGVVIIHPDDNTIIKYEELSRKHEAYRAVIARKSHFPAETKDGFRFQVVGNIELAEEVVSVLDNGGDGIGLFRTEFLYMQRNRFPEEEELYEQYKGVVELMAPRPVTIRTLDINGDKAISALRDSEEANPALGLRAIRFCLSRPNVFMAQLRAILRASIHGNVRIMFPMISGLDEIIEAKKMLEQAANLLEKENIPFDRNIQVGIMIEVPSAVILADAMADHADFFSIGTNDLVQYSLAIDRGNLQVAYLFQPLHPAILKMIKQVVDAAKRKGIRVFMCGEMAADPLNLSVLLGLGLDELSMNPQSIPCVKNMIKKINLREAERFVVEVLKKNTTSEIMALIQDAYGHMIAGGACKD